MAVYNIKRLFITFVWKPVLIFIKWFRWPFLLIGLQFNVLSSYNPTTGITTNQTSAIPLIVGAILFSIGYIENLSSVPERKPKPIIIIAWGIFISAVGAMRVTDQFGLEKWQVSLGLIGLAILLFLFMSVLMYYFIHTQAPDFASTEEVLPDVQAWEVTAGTGIVPKWVSLIGLFSFSALITALLSWVIALLKVLLT